MRNMGKVLTKSDEITPKPDSEDRGNQTGISRKNPISTAT